MRAFTNMLNDALVWLLVIVTVLGAPVMAAVAIVLFAGLIAAPFAGIVFGVLFPLHWFGVI